MRSVRGRFDIVVPFSHWTYVRFTSNPKRSLTPREIADALREYADLIDKGRRPDAGRHDDVAAADEKVADR